MHQPLCRPSQACLQLSFESAKKHPDIFWSETSPLIAWLNGTSRCRFLKVPETLNINPANQQLSARLPLHKLSLFGLSWAPHRVG